MYMEFPQSRRQALRGDARIMSEIEEGGKGLKKQLLSGMSGNMEVSLSCTFCF